MQKKKKILGTTAIQIINFLIRKRNFLKINVAYVIRFMHTATEINLKYPIEERLLKDI